MSNWQEFFESLEDYEAKFRYYESDHGVTAEQLYQAFRARLLDELFDATRDIGNDELAILLQRMIYPPSSLPPQVTNE